MLLEICFPESELKEWPDNHRRGRDCGNLRKHGRHGCQVHRFLCNRLRSHVFRNHSHIRRGVEPILLLVGIQRSKNAADDKFDYGYGAERYVWALISAVGIFFLGCGVTVYHGIFGLLDFHEPMSDFGWPIAVLIVAFFVEFCVLTIAVKSVKKQANGAPLFKLMKTEADPAVVAVVLEDSAACLGVLIAVTATGLTKITGQHHWDAIGSNAIGILLGLIAFWLIHRNRTS